MMSLRSYRSGDFDEVAALFYETVHSVNLRDYSRAQVDAWAPGTPDPERWNRSLLENGAIVAVEDGRIVGFGDLDRANFLDRLYVHREHQGRGIATAICDALERRATGSIAVHASITAKPFFEKRGYRVLKAQQVERLGVLMTNYVMEKPMPDASGYRP